MAEVKNICIRCPRGCEIVTTLDGYGNITHIEGNFCRLGKEYVQGEMTDPRRIVTSTVRVKNGEKPLVPVWTEKPIPKAKVLELSEALRNIVVDAPVKIGQVVMENALGLGINVITSGNVGQKPVE